MGWIDGLLDRSIYFSFDRSGYERHAREFDRADLDVDLRGRVCLVTGANSGLGLATARGLAARGATLWMLCRDPERGAEARDAVARETGSDRVHLAVVDVSRPDAVRGFVEGLAEPRVDVLVHNAGVLPEAREITPEGFERTVATHLVGPHALTALLRPRLVGARVIFVSSGGMYSKRFRLDRMLALTGPYDGVAAYAQTKRAQVILAELWAGALASTGTVVSAMHPGWAATPGVERSLPGFFARMERRLRTPEQGADTILWLAMAPAAAQGSGRFWFDRRAVPTHLVPFTRERPKERQWLWDLLQGAVPSPVASPAGAQVSKTTS